MRWYEPVVLVSDGMVRSRYFILEIRARILSPGGERAATRGVRSKSSEGGAIFLWAQGASDDEAVATSSPFTTTLPDCPNPWNRISRDEHFHN
jgi:hypothetical protein